MTKVGEHITLDIIGTNKEGSYSIVVPIISRVICCPTLVIKIIPFYNFLL